jgi:hypothetical protein
MTWRMSTCPRRILTVVPALAALAVFSTSSAQTARLDVARLLDLYATGKTDEAMARVARATLDQARDLRHRLVSSGHAWIHAGPADLSPRIFAAAVFALELEALLAEQGEWSARSNADCAGRCVVEWGCIILRARTVPDDSERLWLLASIALAGGVRDWTFLQSPLTPPTARTREAVTCCTRSNGIATRGIPARPGGGDRVQVQHCKRVGPPEARQARPRLREQRG